MSDKNIMKAMFLQQRLQILDLGHRGLLSPTYVYAWYEGVYPSIEDTDGSVIPKPHELYKEFFKTSGDKVDKLIKILDNYWLNNDVPTFWELEDRLEVRYQSEWDRHTLIDICRYLYLHDSWDGAFWEKLLTPQQCPSEAHSIISKFNPESDIYFI